MRRLQVGLFHDANDFFEFGHELHAVLQASGGVHQQDIGVLPARGLDGVEGETGGVRPLLAGDDGGVKPLAPNAQLFHGRGAKSVAGAENHSFTLATPFGGELGDGGRLARSVDAHDQHHEGALRGVDLEGQSHRIQDAFDLAGENRAHFLGLDVLFVARGANGLCDARGSGDAEVGAQQHVLEFVERERVELALGENFGDALGDRLRGAE